MAAPAFDPSKPFQVVQQAAPKFDPSQPFQAAQPGAEPGKLESFLRGAKQGATLNFGDEITAGAESLFTDKTYAQAVAEARANDTAAEQANPWSYGGGGLAGGLATALVPGLGAGKIAQAGGAMAKAGQAAMLGSKLGGISAIGASEGGDLSSNIEAGLHGAEAGALGGALLQGGASLVGKAGSYIGQKLIDAVKPSSQLALAVGATSKELNRSTPLYDKVMTSVKLAAKEGLFEDPPNGVLDENILLQRVQAKLAEKGAEIGAEVQKFGDKALPDTTFRRIYLDAADHISKAVEGAPPSERDAVASQLGAALSELEATGGKLSDIWALKSGSGGWAGKGWTMAGMPPPVKEGYMSLNRVLNSALTDETGWLANQVGSDKLKGLNASYSAAATIEPILGSFVGKLDATQTSLGASARDLGVGGAIGGAAAAMGAGGFAGPIGMAGAAVNQWGRSVPGRVMRAQIGQAIEDKAAQASVAMGAIPRKTAEAQAWLQAHVMQLPPEVQQAAAAIVGAPPDRAEQMLRAVMPQFGQHFAKSSFPSELDGKVSTEEDKQAIRKRLLALKLPSSQLALRLSALSGDGTIAVEAYDPQAYGQDLQDLITKMMGPQGGAH